MTAVTPADRSLAGGVLRAWWRGSGALPTSLAGAELCVLIAFVGLRATDIAQLAVSFSSGLQRSTNVGLDVALAVLYLAESVVISVVVVRKRRFYSTAWTSIDLAVGAVVLVCQPLISSDADRIGTWTAWGYAITIGTAFAVGIGFPRRWQSVVASAALTGVYLAVSLPASLARHGLTATVVANAIGYLGFALFPRALAGFLRRLGRDADAARHAAQIAGEQSERDKQRRLLHDHETVLRMLAQPELDPALAELLRRQAITGANRVHNFLNTSTLPTGTTPKLTSTTNLAEIVRTAAVDFGDLPLNVAVTLAEGAHFDEPTAEAVADALTTLLHNVRRHAAATSVVIHADTDSDGWEITVRDNGRGFASDATALGFGLREQVYANLRAHTVHVTVTSEPGEGTLAVMRGRGDSAHSDGRSP